MSRGGVRANRRRDGATAGHVPQRRIRSRRLHRRRGRPREDDRWIDNQTWRRRPRASVEWIAHQRLLARAENLVRENETKTELTLARIDNHCWQRTASRAQESSAT